jgi:8-oxo-dGTP pyrophosphatase MutT (NUDIX family)
MAAVPTTLTITLSTEVIGGNGRVVLTTWGIRAGRYGSLGRVSFPAGQLREADSPEELAALVLTALYGMPYDL